MEEFAYSCKSLNSGSRKQQISFASPLPEVGQLKSAPWNTITEGEHLRRLRGEGSAFVTPRAPTRKCADIGGFSKDAASKQEQPPLAVPAKTLIRGTQMHKRCKYGERGEKEPRRKHHYFCFPNSLSVGKTWLSLWETNSSSQMSQFSS